MPPVAPRILVPLKSPQNEQALVRLGAVLASKPWGELHLTHIETPRAAPVAHIDELLQQAVETATDMDVGAIAHLERGETVTEEIQRAVRRWNCNMMVMGWYDAVDGNAVKRSDNRALAKLLDVDTLILKDRNFQRPRRILVPSSGGANALMGIQIAYDLAQFWQVDLEILRIARDPVCRPNDPILLRYCQQLRENAQLQLRLLNIDASITVLPSTQVIPPIVERAEADDLIILGASNDWRQENFLAGSIPDEIANQAPCSVLMVRSSAAQQARLSQVFWEHTIRLNFRPRDKWDAITQMVDALVEEKQVPASQRQKVLKAAFDREHKSSTGLGRHIAIPHAPIADIPAVIGSMAICPGGVDFDAADGKPVHFIFLLLTPEQNYHGYIPLLAQIAALLQTQAARTALLQCQIPSELTALIRAGERDS